MSRFSRTLVVALLVAVNLSAVPLRPEDRPKKKTDPYAGRSGPLHNQLLKAHGGNSQSEAAVARGLLWLAKQQKPDGSWEFDGTNKSRIAATGMALAPFLVPAQG